MKTRRSLTSSGAVLAFALLIMVVAATILGGIAQLAVTQTIAGQAEWVAASRRIQLENSRALARQYILSQMWRGYGALAPASLSVSGLGGFTLTSVDPALGYWLSLRQDAAARINPFNLFERGGFQSAWATGSLNSGAGDVPWGFQVRTRSPIVAGFSFVNQLPAENAWQPAQRVDMRAAAINYASGFTALPRMPVSSVTNSSIAASTVRMEDLGYLEAPKAEAAFGDVLQTVDGVETAPVDPADPAEAAQVVIDLNTFGYFVGQSDSQFYEVPFAADLVSTNDETTQTNYAVPVTSLVLVGGAASAGPPLQVVIPAGNATLTNVTLSGNNQRIVYFYRQGISGLTISTAGGNSEFRIGMTLEGPADLRVAGGLTVVGGIRTASALTQSTGDTVVFSPELNPTWKYDAIADRMMWLEDQQMR